MRLSDIMSHMDLAVYPQVALVIFLAVFASVLVRLYRAGGADLQSHAGMALDEPASEAERPHGEPREGRTTP